MLNSIYNTLKTNQALFKKSPEIKAFVPFSPLFSDKYHVYAPRGKRSEGYITLDPVLPAQIKSQLTEALISLSDTQKKILSVGLNFADNSGEFVLSQYQWALMVGISRSYLQKQLKELERWGYIASRYNHKRESTYKIAQELLSKQSKNCLKNLSKRDPKTTINTFQSEYEALSIKNIYLFKNNILPKDIDLTCKKRSYLKISLSNEVKLRSARAHVGKAPTFQNRSEGNEVKPIIFDSVTFSPDQKTKLNSYGESILMFAAKKLSQARKEHRKLDHEAAWILRICENEVAKQTGIYLTQQSFSDSSKKGSSEQQKPSVSQANKRNYDRQTQIALNKHRDKEEFKHVVKRLSDAEKIVRHGQQTYDKYPTEENLRWLENYKRMYELRKAIYDQMVDLYGEYNPASEIPLEKNISTDSYADTLGSMMPDYIKEEIITLRMKGDTNPKLYNNPVLDKILSDYLQKRKVKHERQSDSDNHTGNSYSLATGTS